MIVWTYHFYFIEFNYTLSYHKAFHSFEKEFLLKVFNSYYLIIFTSSEEVEIGEMQ